MKPNYLQEYKAYYSVRAERYADNPNYQNSYKAEKDLSDAMQSCNALEEFRDKIGNLNELCAIAIVKDQSLMEKEHFLKHQEKVRAQASEQIHMKADSCKDALELSSIIAKTENENSIQISMDESHREFQHDWDQIDEITIYENAVVPDRYKKGMLETANKIKESINQSIESLESNNQDWETGWKIKPELNLEYRHRRLLPYKEEHIREQLKLYKSIINR